VILDFIMHFGSRRGVVVVWIVPALAILAVAAIWFLTPTGPTSRPPTEASSGAKLGDKNQAIAPLAIKEPKSAVAISSSKLADSRPAATAVKSTKQPPGLSELSEAEIKRGLTGSWTGYYQGQREMQVSADGQGTMVAHPEGLAATLLAAELTFQFQWKLKGLDLEFETVTGEPADKIKIVVSMYGKIRSHKILELKPDEMVLLDEDGVTKYLWKRMATKAASDITPAK
jgi:hypothetical protein